MATSIPCALVVGFAILISSFQSHFETVARESVDAEISDRFETSHRRFRGHRQRHVGHLPEGWLYFL